MGTHATSQLKSVQLLRFVLTVLTVSLLCTEVCSKYTLYVVRYVYRCNVNVVTYMAATKLPDRRHPENFCVPLCWRRHFAIVLQKMEITLNLLILRR